MIVIKYIIYCGAPGNTGMLDGSFVPSTQETQLGSRCIHSPVVSNRDDVCHCTLQEHVSSRGSLVVLIIRDSPKGHIIL